MTLIHRHEEPSLLSRDGAAGRGLPRVAMMVPLRFGLAAPLALLTHAIREITGESPFALRSTDRGLEPDDIAASFYLEFDVRRMEALGFAGKFCSAVAHELSTPLNVISGRIALALGKLPPTSAARDDLQVMLAQTERLAHIIHTALEPLRPPRPTLRAIELQELLAPILPPLETRARARGVAFTAPSTFDGLRVNGDARQLRPVITMIVANALETTPNGGRVSVSARRVRAQDRERLRLEISDGGPGLSPQLVARVFDPIFMAKTTTHGVSLALSAARDILRGHHGELRVHSELGVGTTFTLELSIIDEETR